MRRLLGGVLLLVGCNRGLSPEQAAEELGKETGNAIYCAWQGPRKFTDTRWAFLAVDKANPPCAAAFEKAGLAKVGECVEPGYGGRCMRTEITPTGKNKSAMFGTNELGFTCGVVEFRRVVSVTTSGNDATVRFIRNTTLDTGLLDSLEACVLNKPPAGEQELERRFRRDDSGAWSLVKP